MHMEMWNGDGVFSISSPGLLGKSPGDEVGVFYHWAVPQAAHAIIRGLCMYTTQTLSFFVHKKSWSCVLTVEII